MPDLSQLKHLVTLLEDDSSIVRETVITELASYGHSLRSELSRQNIETNEEAGQIIQSIIEDQNRDWLRLNWHTLKTIDDDKLRLETAMSMLSAYQTDTTDIMKLPLLLDRLADEFRASTVSQDVHGLANFLFDVKGITGAESSEYYDPGNSNLISVIEQKRGIPISLSLIYMLIGKRMNFKIEGCNFPGHFLTTVEYNQKQIIVDCFDKGKFITEKDPALFNKSLPVTPEEILHLQCNAETILGRVLRNLINAYHSNCELENERLMSDLLMAAK